MPSTSFRQRRVASISKEADAPIILVPESRSTAPSIVTVGATEVGSIRHSASPPAGSIVTEEGTMWDEWTSEGGVTYGEVVCPNRTMSLLSTFSIVSTNAQSLMSEESIRSDYEEDEDDGQEQESTSEGGGTTVDRANATSIGDILDPADEDSTMIMTVSEERDVVCDVRYDCHDEVAREDPSPVEMTCDATAKEGRDKAPRTRGVTLRRHTKTKVPSMGLIKRRLQFGMEMKKFAKSRIKNHDAGKGAMTTIVENKEREISNPGSDHACEAPSIARMGPNIDQEGMDKRHDEIVAKSSEPGEAVTEPEAEAATESAPITKEAWIVKVKGRFSPRRKLHMPSVKNRKERDGWDSPPEASSNIDVLNLLAPERESPKTQTRIEDEPSIEDLREFHETRPPSSPKKRMFHVPSVKTHMIGLMKSFEREIHADTAAIRKAACDKMKMELHMTSSIEAAAPTTKSCPVDFDAVAVDESVTTGQKLSEEQTKMEDEPIDDYRELLKTSPLSSPDDVDVNLGCSILANFVNFSHAEFTSSLCCAGEEGGSKARDGSDPQPEESSDIAVSNLIANERESPKPLTRIEDEPIDDYREFHETRPLSSPKKRKFHVPSVKNSIMGLMDFFDREIHAATAFTRKDACDKLKMELHTTSLIEAAAPTTKSCPVDLDDSFGSDESSAAAINESVTTDQELSEEQTRMEDEPINDYREFFENRQSSSPDDVDVNLGCSIMANFVKFSHAECTSPLCCVDEEGGSKERDGSDPQLEESSDIAVSNLIANQRESPKPLMREDEPIKDYREFHEMRPLNSLDDVDVNPSCMPKPGEGLSLAECTSPLSCTSEEGESEKRDGSDSPLFCTGEEGGSEKRNGSDSQSEASSNVAILNIVATEQELSEPVTHTQPKQVESPQCASPHLQMAKLEHEAAKSSKLGEASTEIQGEVLTKIEDEAVELIFSYTERRLIDLDDSIDLDGSFNGAPMATTEVAINKTVKMAHVEKKEVNTNHKRSKSLSQFKEKQVKECTQAGCDCRSSSTLTPEPISSEELCRTECLVPHWGASCTPEQAKANRLELCLALKSFKEKEAEALAKGNLACAKLENKCLLEEELKHLTEMRRRRRAVNEKNRQLMIKKKKADVDIAVLEHAMAQRAYALSNTEAAKARDNARHVLEKMRASVTLNPLSESETRDTMESLQASFDDPAPKRKHQHIPHLSRRNKYSIEIETSDSTKSSLSSQASTVSHDTIEVCTLSEYLCRLGFNLLDDNTITVIDTDSTDETREEE